MDIMLGICSENYCVNPSRKLPFKKVQFSLQIAA